MINLKYVASAMEKTAWIWPAINVAFAGMGMAGDYKANKGMSKLSPLNKDDRYALQAPYAYQFDGGKNLPTQPTVGIN